MSEKKSEKSVSDLRNTPATDVPGTGGEALSVANINVVAYMAGYLLRKCPVNHCPVCHSKFMLLHQPDDVEYTSLRHKAYRAEGTLVYPTPLFLHFVKQLESTFMADFESLMHMHGVLARLCQHAEVLAKDLHCDDEVCASKVKSMTYLYMKVRLMHALKVSNVVTERNVAGVKRNRKLLKLNHS